MRLRLDKLVLSAGLALAMVATSIPAIASTTTATSTTESGLTLVSDGSAVNLNDSETKATFVSDVIGVTAGTDTTVSGITKVTAISTISGFEEDTVNQDSSQFTSEIVTGDKMKKAAGLKVKESSITITETYNFNGYSFETSGVTGTSTQQADADTAEGAAKAAAREKVLTEVKKALDLEDDNTSNPTVNLSSDTVAVTEAGTLTATSVANTTDSSKYDGTCTVAAKTRFNVNGSVTVTKVYTVETLPSKYTFDLVFSDADYSTGRDYKLVKDEILPNGNHDVNYVEGTKVNNGKDLLYSTTDLDSTTNYYLVYNLVSSSDNLFFGDDEDGEDAATQEIAVSDTVTLTVISVTAPVDSADFDTVAKANNAKIAGYFTATLSSVETYTDSEVTVKIVKPKDIEALAGEGKTIKYTVIRQHEGRPIEALETNSDGEYITFSSQYFSTFALAYEVVDAETPTENPTEEEQQSQEQQSGDATPAGGSNSGSGSSENGASSKTADNSMMPLFMTTLLLALCAGSLAIYKEKKTN